MAKIVRYNGNLAAFGSNAAGVERTVFGGVLQSDTLADNINADFLTGWGIVSASTPPSKQDFNGLGYTTTFLLSYLHQMGIAEWNSSQEYYLGSATITAGNLYISKVTPNTGNNPATDTVSWKLMAAMEDLEDAVSITYDNIASGLAATNVQDALDELSISSSITYDNAISGLAATNVKTAIDELVVEAGIPAGAVQFFAMATAPTGWLQANGAAISRAAYSVLFAAIGITYGAGDGALTFNIPDMRGQFARGWDDGAGVDIGRVMGSNQDDALEQHSHYSGIGAQSSELDAYCKAGYTTDVLGGGRHVQGEDAPSGVNGVTSGVLSSGASISGAKEGATTSANTAQAETRVKNIALFACIKY